MNSIEKLAAEYSRENESIRQKLRLANYLYNDIRNDKNAEMLDELIGIVLECSRSSRTRTSEEKRRFSTEVAEAFYRHLISSGISEKTAYDYVMRVKRTLNGHGITPDQAVYERIDLKEYIDLYTRGGKLYEQNLKSNNAISSSLKRFKRFLDEIERLDGGTPGDPALIPMAAEDTAPEGERVLPHLYLAWSEGYQSFSNRSRHISSYTIDGESIEISYSDGTSLKKSISPDVYEELVGVFLKYRTILSNEERSVFDMFPNGGVSSYSYEFDGCSRSDIPFLFDGNNRSLVDAAYTEFSAVMSLILD